MIPESHADLLKKPVIAHLATIGSGGGPHSTPVWCDWDGRHVLLNTNKGRQKYRNLVRDPRVALSIVDPADPFRHLQVQGTAVIEDDSDLAGINSLSNKYIGQDYPFLQPGEERVVIKVKPEHVTSQG